MSVVNVVRVMTAMHASTKMNHAPSVHREELELIS
jgi:hypothetical protein